MVETQHILIVEDDDDTQANLSDILELDGYQVLSASTAQEALNHSNWNQISSILLDRKLPDGDAETVLPQLKSLAPHAEIIVMTGYADLDGSIAALRQGAVDYLIKPINPDALRTSLHRISHRKHLERELHRQHQLNERIFRTAEAAIVVLDLEGNIIRTNPYLERVLGYSAEEMQGTAWIPSFIPEQYRDSIQQVFEHTVEGQDTGGTINPIRSKDGICYEFRWSNSTLHDDSGKMIAVLSIGLDITELLETQQRALQAERLATIGQTMTALAHESRNALQRIQCAVELVEIQLEDNLQVKRDLSKIATAAGDLQRRLEEIRMYAAPIQLDLEQCSLPAIWRSAWMNLKTVHSTRNFQLTETVHARNLQMNADRSRLEQVFRNLFENSMEAGEEPILIDILCHEYEYRGSQGLSVIIRDNGPGFNPEQRQKLFQPFYTTKSTGTGLGMAIVQRIVQAHQGTIELGTDHHSGAELILRFPITLPRE